MLSTTTELGLLEMSSLKAALFQMLMFAQGDAAPAGGAAPDGAAQPGNPLQLLFPLAVGGIMFYLMMIRPEQRKQKERQSKLEALKKNDKVLTIGGIIGTIVDFSNDGARVTLRVDDGTRIKFVRSSIQGLYDEKSEAESADK